MTSPTTTSPPIASTASQPLRDAARASRSREESPMSRRQPRSSQGEKEPLGAMIDGPPPDGHPQGELTTAAVAGLFHVTKAAVLYWANREMLPCVWVRGCRRYPAAAVAELARDHNVLLPEWLSSMALHANGGAR